jgi:hypothetical protein
VEVAGTWLDSDPRDASAPAAARDAQRRADVERAQLYQAAFSSPAGRKLLAQWDSEIANLRVDVNASLSMHVAAEAYRGFVRKIHDQINLATSEGK